MLIMLALPHNLLLRQQFIILISFLSSLKRQPGKHVIISLPRNHGDLYKTNNLDIRSSVLSVGKVCHGSMSSSAMLCTRLYKKRETFVDFSIKIDGTYMSFDTATALTNVNEICACIIGTYVKNMRPPPHKKKYNS